MKTVDREGREPEEPAGIRKPLFYWSGNHRSSRKTAILGCSLTQFRPNDSRARICYKNRSLNPTLDPVSPQL
jgi:hypothetical protein